MSIVELMGRSCERGDLLFLPDRCISLKVFRMIWKSLLATALLCGSQACSGAVVAEFDFDTNGQPGGWNLTNATRLVSGGVLQGIALSNDPQMIRAPGDEFARSTAPGVAWDTFEVVSRELDSSLAVVPFDPTGTLLIFNTQPGTTSTNFGAPTTVSAADPDGFQTLTWDISSFAGVTTGGVRVDVIGGPGTTAGTPNNRFQITSLTVSDTAVAVPEPSSLAALACVGVAAVLRRRRNKNA